MTGSRFVGVAGWSSTDDKREIWPGVDQAPGARRGPSEVCAPCGDRARLLPLSRGSHRAAGLCVCVCARARSCVVWGGGVPPPAFRQRSLCAGASLTVGSEATECVPRVCACDASAKAAMNPDTASPRRPGPGVRVRSCPTLRGRCFPAAPSPVRAAHEPPSASVHAFIPRRRTSGQQTTAGSGSRSLQTLQAEPVARRLWPFPEKVAASAPTHESTRRPLSLIGRCPFRPSCCLLHQRLPLSDPS